MKTSFNYLLLLCGAVSIIFSSCSASMKLSKIRSKSLNSSLSLPSEKELQRYGGQSRVQKADEDGLFALRTVRDSITGETMGSEDLDAAIIIARFRNTAERHGLVNFDFMIVASDSLQDPSWQLRFFPMVHFDNDSIPLAPVYLTGYDFRRSQLRAYGRYEDYMNGIRRDSSFFVDRIQSEAFSQRFPVCDLSESELEKHFRRNWLVQYNAHKVARQESVRKKLLTNPLAGSEIRDDATGKPKAQRFVYVYTQSIPSRRNLSKFTLTIRTQIYDGKKVIYHFPVSSPITYYVSSLSTLLDRNLLETHPDDTTYSAGIKALSEREWERALELLAPYEDYNTALAYLSLEYNATASNLLESLPYESAGIHYLLALAYSRRGLEAQAVEQLKKAVQMEPSYKYRGNLDPEIASIINKFSLFKEDDYSIDNFL